MTDYVAKLNSRSAVFDRMLDQNMKETETGEVEILDVNPDTLKQLLEFIYTGQVIIHQFSKVSRLSFRARWKMSFTLQNFSTLQTNMNSAAW